jgi:hypothetical protein
VLTPGRERKKSAVTNQRLKQLFTERINQGKIVSLEFAEVEDFSINGVTFTNRSMHNPFHRRMLENLLLAVEQRSKDELLNKYEDWATKSASRLDELLKKLPPGHRAAILNNIAALLQQELKRRGSEQGRAGA